MNTDVISIEKTDAEAIRNAADALRDGRLVVFPTETVYGVGALVTSDGGITRLRGVKNRPGGRPFTLHIAEKQAATHYAGDLPPVGRRLIERAWPGPLTLIVEVAGEPAAWSELSESHRDELYHEGTIGFRCPDHPVAKALLAAVDGPVVAASANRAGRPAPTDADGAAAELDGDVSIVLDAGATRYNKASTIVKVSAAGLTVVREGVLDATTVRKLSSRTVLFVCTGNICRSPMAAGLYAARLAAMEGCTTDELAERGLVIASAGTAAFDGGPASGNAVAAMAERKIDIRNHQSRPLTEESIREADRIVCMSYGHRQAARSFAPEAEDKILLLADPDGIADPIGGDLDVYRRCAQCIDQGLDALIESGKL